MKGILSFAVLALVIYGSMAFDNLLLRIYCGLFAGLTFFVIAVEVLKLATKEMLTYYFDMKQNFDKYRKLRGGNG